MEKKPKIEMTKTKPINIILPAELIDRVNVVCTDKDIPIQEFVTDAIIDKLELVYKDRRKRPDCKWHTLKIACDWTICRDNSLW